MVTFITKKKCIIVKPIQYLSRYSKLFFYDRLNFLSKVKFFLPDLKND